MEDERYVYSSRGDVRSEAEEWSVASDCDWDGLSVEKIW